MDTKGRTMHFGHFMTTVLNYIHCFMGFGGIFTSREGAVGLYQILHIVSKHKLFALVFL